MEEVCRLTQPFLEYFWLLLPGYSQPINWNSCYYDDKSNNTLRGVVEEREEDEVEHNDHEEDGEEQVHLWRRDDNDQTPINTW